MSFDSLVIFLIYQLGGLLVLGLFVTAIHKILARFFPEAWWL